MLQELREFLCSRLLFWLTIDARPWRSIICTSTWYTVSVPNFYMICQKINGLDHLPTKYPELFTLLSQWCAIKRSISNPKLNGCLKQKSRWLPLVRALVNGLFSSQNISSNQQELIQSPSKTLRFLSTSLHALSVQVFPVFPHHLIPSLIGLQSF